MATPSTKRSLTLKNNAMLKLIVLGIFVVALIFTLALIFKIHVDSSHKLLAEEKKKLSTPSGCTEIVNYYHNDLVALGSRWISEYKCQTTGEQAYNSITENLTKLGYQKGTDYTEPGPNCCVYNFSYTKDRFTVYYKFVPSIYLGSKSIEEVQNSLVDKISLDIVRR